MSSSISRLPLPSSFAASGGNSSISDLKQSLSNKWSSGTGKLSQNMQENNTMTVACGSRQNPAYITKIEVGDTNTTVTCSDSTTFDLPLSSPIRGAKLYSVPPGLQNLRLSGKKSSNQQQQTMSAQDQSTTA